MYIWFAFKSGRKERKGRFSLLTGQSRNGLYVKMLKIENYLYLEKG
jgi:hypothetical protein